MSASLSVCFSVLLASSLNICFCPPYIVHSSCCSLFSQTQRSPHVFYRHDLINQLQHNHALVTLVAENLSAYMETMRQFSKGTISGPEMALCVSWTFHCHTVSTAVESGTCTVCSLTGCMCTFIEEQAEFDPQTVRPGSRYSHVQEVQERLNFLRYNITITCSH